MASRTKSFFDQSGTSKKPAHWHRSNDFDKQRQPLGEKSSNTPVPRPPIPATSQAKSKLKAFVLEATEPEKLRDDGASESISGPSEAAANVREEPHVNTPADSEAMQPEASSAPAPAGKATKTPQLPHAHTFPCTPGDHLPLEDLIGDLNDAPRVPQAEEGSPEEQLGWIPNSSSTLLTPNRRKRKRARSSSPSCPATSSERQEASAVFAAPVTQTEKRTPEADPTAALWQTYGLDKGAGSALKLSDFSHLVAQASPRPIETPIKSGGFRRWASTGNDWPTSKSKRQRTETRANINQWRDMHATDSAGKTKVAAMVERLQETLATQKLAQSAVMDVAHGDVPSSSSPLPKTGARLIAAPAASPLEARQPPPAPTLPRRSDSVRPPPKAVCEAPARPLVFDNPRVDETISSQMQSTSDPSKPTVLHLQSKAPLPAYKRPAISRSTSGSGRQYPVKQRTPPPPPPPTPPPVLFNSDDFDEDFDLTAEDLDELASQGPSREASNSEVVPAPAPAALSVAAAPMSPRSVMPRPQQAIVIDDDDDEFGDDDLDADVLAEAEFSATQAHRASHPAQNVMPISPRKRSPRKSRSPRKVGMASSTVSVANDGVNHLNRYRVKQVVDGEYTNLQGRRCPEKLLLANDERANKPVAITLRDSWVDTSISPGTIIHVSKLKSRRDATADLQSPPGQLLISDLDDSPFLIIHPDHMLSATTVADSFDCLRKAVLQDRIKATGLTNKAMVYGKILHEVFQQALTANQWDAHFLAELVQRNATNHVEGLWELGMADAVLAVEEVTAKMGELSAWAKIFVAAHPSDASLVDDKQGEKVWMSISKLIAIEEHIWSPQYGLKGNIDATIESTLVDHPRELAKKLVAPFEVKTGRTTQSPAHRAQTALYTLLLLDRYDVGVNAGILYYLESSSMSRIAPPLREIRQMIQQRNRLASYIHRAKRLQKSGDEELQSMPQTQEIEDSGLPSLLKNPFKCGRCYAQQSCFSYHALVENGTADTAGMIDDSKKTHSQVWHEAVGHLELAAKNRAEADALKAWFAKWDRLLTFEESEQSRYRKELWTMSSSEREAVGRCFGNLVLQQELSTTAPPVTQAVVDGIEGSGGKINRFAYVFKRATHVKGASFTEGTQLTVGEPVVVSSEAGQWALANGYVVAATKYDITVAVDRKLSNARERLQGFDEERNHAFRGIMTVGDAASEPSADDRPILYRLDKDEFSNGLALVRNNLVMLMSSHPIHTKLRRQVIFSDVPTFGAPSQLPTMPASQLGNMNEDQSAAVAKVLSANDYALILGMPGTGKTTTIAHIIRALLADNKTILLTSFTHTAVDNILLKVRDIAPPNSILRLGVPAKINPEVQRFCQLAATARTTIEEIEAAYMGCRIVATTCMGTNHAIFNRRAFDVCIVDEASQITLPTALGPLLHARKFVLVGDHYQLPPLVQNRAALEGGLDVSYFRQLSEEQPQAVATLGKQYRMCEDIMSLSNELIYNGQLRCGNDAVAQRTINITDLSPLQILHPPSVGINGCNSRCWISELAKPERKVVFANTDSSDKDALERLTSGKNITNQLEAVLSAQLILSLLKLGVPGKDIGAITLYRSQLALMRQLFKAVGIGADVEIDSADRFQGRDKECIILSMVRSNEAGIVGDLLKDWRRVNVALTRARSKLIVLGSRRTLVNNELLAKFMTLVDRSGWAVDLPYGADTLHAFDFSSQSTSSLALQLTPSPRKIPRSPKEAAHSPRKSLAKAPSQVLQPSLAAVNRGPRAQLGSQSRLKQPRKVVKGGKGAGKMRYSRCKEQVAMEIFEDLTADDI